MMVAVNFFYKVGKKLGFDYTPFNSYLYEFIKNDIIKGSLSIKDIFFDEEQIIDDIYYFITNKFIVRERFYTILLITSIEILNYEYSLEDGTPSKVVNIMREYSYHDNVTDNDVDKYAKSIKDKFSNINKEIKENVLGKYIFLFKNDEKNPFLMINNSEEVASRDNLAQLASINLALKEI